MRNWNPNAMQDTGKRLQMNQAGTNIVVTYSGLGVMVTDYRFLSCCFRFASCCFRFASTLILVALIFILPFPTEFLIVS